MDKSLLRKTAIQSVALMLTVITLSYTLQEYRTVTISAKNSATSEETLSLDEILNTSNNPSNDPKIDYLGQSGANSEVHNNPEGVPPIIQLLSNVDTNMLAKLGESFLVIKKPGGDDIAMELKDLYIKKGIQLQFTGLDMALETNMVAREHLEEAFIDLPVYKEIPSSTTGTDDENSEPVYLKDYGNDFVRQIIITNNFNEMDKKYTSDLFIELDSVYTYSLYEDDSYYYIDLKKPQEVYDRVLVIDAGHGGKDAGALSRGEEYYEKNINLDILLHLKELLDKENIKVYYTRTADDQVYLRPRVELANSVDCDFFISIHCNANTVSGPNGSEIYYYDTDFKGVKAEDLATLFLEELKDNTSLKKRYIMKKKDDEIYILKKAVVPAILIEVGYLTNNKDMKYLSKSDNRKAVAQGIFNSIMKAYELYYPTN